MKKYSSILLLIILLGILLFAIFKEKHEVYSLGDGKVKKINGYELTETATYDGLMLNKRNGKAYDIYSLTPPFLQLKDCAT